MQNKRPCRREKDIGGKRKKIKEGKVKEMEELGSKKNKTK